MTSAGKKCCINSPPTIVTRIWTLYEFCLHRAMRWHGMRSSFVTSTTALYLVEFCLAIFRGPVIPWYLWQLSNMAGQWSIWKSIWLRISAPGMPSPGSDLSPEPFLGEVAQMRTIGQGQNLHHCSSVEERSKGWLDSNRGGFCIYSNFLPAT